jgi:thioredoxin 1
MRVKNDSETEITEQEFYEVVNNSNTLVVVNFFAEWNMTCLMQAPIVEEIAEKMKEVKFVKVNMDENQELACKCKISTVPCLVVFKNGVETCRIHGNQTSEVIQEKIKGCLKG